jgi:hypothetical protein
MWACGRVGMRHRWREQFDESIPENLQQWHMEALSSKRRQTPYDSNTVFPTVTVFMCKMFQEMTVQDPVSSALSGRGRSIYNLILYQRRGPHLHCSYDLSHFLGG